MSKKEKQVEPIIAETNIELTPSVEPETTEAAKTKSTTKKTKSDAAKKTTTKKTTAKTTKASKEVIKEVVKEVVKVVTPQVFLQYAGTEISAPAIMDQVKALWIADGHDEASINSLSIYIKPEESAAYYVINETETGKIDF